MPEWDWLEPRVAGGLILVAAAINCLLALRHFVFREPTLSAHFSPKGGCMAAIVAEIAAARSEVLLQAYSFSCPDIAPGTDKPVHLRARAAA